MKTKTIEIPSQEINKMQQFLDSEGDGTINVVKVYTADFGDNGEGSIQVDIKVVDGEKPFVDPVLFQDGHEVGCIECTDTLEGEYTFSDFMKEDYTVLVKRA